MTDTIDTQATNGLTSELPDNLPEPLGEVISGLTAELSQIHDRLEETTEKKDERIEQLEETVEQQQEAIEEKDERIEMQSGLIHDLADRVDGLEDQLETEQRVSAEMGQQFKKGLETQSSNITGVHNRINGLKETIEETGSEDATPGVEGPKSGLEDYQTPMEFITATPEHLVDQLGLSENQERARAIAIDIMDYSEKAPAGRVIDSSTVKKVLTARMGGTAHNQTVSRVMKYFAILGGNQVEHKERDDRNNILVIDPEAAKTYHSGCDLDMDETLLNSVTIAG